MKLESSDSDGQQALVRDAGLDGVEGGVPYVISELLEGESLRERLDRGLLPYRKALDYGVQVTGGVRSVVASMVYLAERSYTAVSIL